ncbi:probable ATP-dependent RNA helicase DDX31 isoform X2 [Lontra canadensis]|uniref:probable ATP-dependent RNA helicase DDX31 isoform X2 n=1 Tax=Lontra canadensis TaxID=76717 RepID=UPI0013F2F6FE|nr:probable ATP-dependent RNA helicase DDX31 isoform X2 [Lontra canadensis]
MGTILAPGASSLRSRRPGWRFEQRAPGGSRVSVAPARVHAPAPAAASTYPQSPGREWERRLHARGGGAGSTMVPGAAAAAAAPCPFARRALSSSCKLSGSAVDKKPGRPSASLPGSDENRSLRKHPPSSQRCIKH